MTFNQGPRGSDERGVTMVIFAIALVALFTFAGLVIDGGNAYATRRQMQNAADASALAGTQTLDHYHRQDTTGDVVTADEIRADALATAVDNDIDAGDFVCDLVDETTAVIGTCPTSSSATVPANAAGVRVRVGTTENTFLMKIVGTEDFTAHAQAAAQVQALREITPGSAPFMICGNGLASGGFDPPLLIPSGSSWAVNPAAIYDEATDSPRYEIHAPQVPDCGSGSNAFKGWVQDGPYSIPGWWDSQPGNRAGPARSVLSPFEDACEAGDLDDCVLAVPICVDGQGNGTNVELYCVRFGAFRVWQTHANKHQVALLNEVDPIIREGGGGGLPVDDLELRLIKLVE